tara:strand:+ start:469 stop:573 length:105 start_codon:yes stop_codon:yes gene_type:complete
MIESKWEAIAKWYNECNKLHGYTQLCPKIREIKK